jgi:hypothetical protein
MHANDKKRTTGRYRNLRSGVRSFTEGFTGIVGPEFEALARHAVETGVAEYELDFLGKTSTPPCVTAAQPSDAWLFTHPEPEDWLKRIGCGVAHILVFKMRVAFDLSTVIRVKPLP